LRSWYAAGQSCRSYADRARRSTSSVPVMSSPRPRPALPARPPGRAYAEDGIPGVHEVVPALRARVTQVRSRSSV
jgi:hypothetical protein